MRLLLKKLEKPMNHNLYKIQDSLRDLMKMEMILITMKSMEELVKYIKL